MSMFSSYVNKVMNNNKEIFGGKGGAGGTTEALNEEAEELITNIPPPDLSAGEVDPEGNLGPVHDPRRAKYGRIAANLNPGAGASILTGR